MINFLMITMSQASGYEYVWQTIPEVHVCDQHVSQKEVVDSLGYWQENLGVRISHIEFNSSCTKSENVIKIYRNKKHVEDFGMTHLNYYYYNNNPEKRIITGVAIELSDHMIRNENITLRHEFGHAFGLLHEEKGIMKPYW
jgi:hypothetical protein